MVLVTLKFKTVVPLVCPFTPFFSPGSVSNQMANTVLEVFHCQNKSFLVTGKTVWEKPTSWMSISVFRQNKKDVFIQYVNVNKEEVIQY